MTIKLRLALSILVFLFCSGMYAQDCTLGLGGRDSEVIVQVFQLSQQQQAKMQVWMGELQQYHKEKTDQIGQLFDSHPQTTTEELQQLANKYKDLRDEVVATAREYDQKLLSTFNERQYERYIALCREANRLPMSWKADSPIPAVPE